MKKIILIALLLCVKIVHGQDIIKVDTTVGHGYELMVFGKSENRTVKDYTFDQVKFKLDSIGKLKNGWDIPNTSQLKSLFDAFKSRYYTNNQPMKWQSVFGLYWCKGNDSQTMVAAGARNIQSFIKLDGLIDKDLTDRGGVKKVKYRLLLIKPY